LLHEQIKVCLTQVKTHLGAHLSSSISFACIILNGNHKAPANQLKYCEGV